MLSDIPSDVPLWEATDEQLAKRSSAWRLWDRLMDIPGVSTARASKLLARKRPHLMPILDSVIIDTLHLEGRSLADAKGSPDSSGPPSD